MQIMCALQLCTVDIIYFFFCALDSGREEWKEGDGWHICAGMSTKQLDFFLFISIPIPFVMALCCVCLCKPIQDCVKFIYSVL